MSVKTLWADSEYRATVQETEFGLYWALWRGDARVNGGLLGEGFPDTFATAYDYARSYARRDRTLRFKESMMFDTEIGRWVRKDGTDIVAALRESELL